MGISQRKDGTFDVYLRVGGKRLATTARTRQEAEAKLHQLQRELGLLDRSATLATAFSLLLARPLKPRTRLEYQELWDRFCQPLANQPLRSLSPAAIRLLLRSVPGQRQPAKVYALLHRLCTLACREGLLLDNPLDHIPKPTYRPPRRPIPWGNDELHRFLAVARQSGREGLFCCLLVTTGLRIGEALALTWEDLSGTTLTIRQTAQRRQGRWLFAPPKTAAGFRRLSLPPSLAAALHTLPRTGPFLFGGDEPPSPRRIATVLRRLCQQAAVPPLSPHQLRHLHASLLLDAGIPIPQVAAQLGHASPEITLRVYAHALPHQTGAASLFEPFLTLPPASPPADSGRGALPPPAGRPGEG